jgi:hypothetical protein
MRCEDHRVYRLRWEGPLEGSAAVSDGAKAWVLPRGKPLLSDDVLSLTNGFVPSYRPART